MPNEPYDWVDDDSMSAEETMRRFRALNPTPTTGPVAQGANYTADFTSRTAVPRPESTRGSLDVSSDEPKSFDPRSRRLVTVL